MHSRLQQRPKADVRDLEARGEDTAVLQRRGHGHPEETGTGPRTVGGGHTGTLGRK